MTRSNFLPAALAVALLTACGPTQVVVIAEISSADPSADLSPLGDLEIRLFPYDRDLIFDSLTAISETPEPAIPDSVLDAQNQVAAAQQAWRDLEALALNRAMNSFSSLARSSFFSFLACRCRSAISLAARQKS